jgi:hypothetical protein
VTVRDLQRELAALRAENARLRRRLGFFERHPELQSGDVGEARIAQLVGGRSRGHPSSFDITARNGARIEVKTSTLTIVTPNTVTKRWAWMRILGQDGRKQYEYLVLLGLRDDRFTNQYADPKSPYVMFVVPWSDVPKVTMGKRHVQIQLTTNPSMVGPRGRLLFTKYQVTEAQLARRVGVRLRPIVKLRRGRRSRPSAAA